MKKFLKILISVVLAAAIVAVSFVGYKPRSIYDAAVDAMRQGDYEMARSHLERLNTADADDLLSQLYFVPNRITTVYEDGKTQIQGYAYNRKGNVVKAELIEDELVLSTTNYTYTEDDKMLTMITTLPEQVWPESTVECYYDMAGNLTCHRTYGDEGLFYQTTYTYNTLNQQMNWFYVEGTGQWARVEYTYDEAGRVVAEKETTAADAEGSMTHYEYHPNGAVKMARRTGPEGTMEISYDEGGNLLRREVISPEGEKTVDTYTYNEQGLLTQLAYGDGRKDIYHYDKAGLLTYSRTEVPGGEWREERMEYSDGLLIKRQVNEADRETYIEQFKRNKKGLCTTYQYKNETTGAWHKRTYTYDRYGNIEKEVYEAATDSYERTIKWKTRHYPKGMPQMIEDIAEDYRLKEN